MEAAEAVRRWVAAWERAWPAGDVDALSDVYSEDTVFYSQPFRDAQAPRDYAAWTFADQASAECRFGLPIVEHDRAAVDWWAVIASCDGTEETVAGTSLLRFGPDGRVVEQRDAWAAEPGRRHLSAWAR